MTWFISDSFIDFGLAVDLELTIDPSVRNLFSGPAVAAKFDTALMRAANEIRDFWEGEAGRNLRSSRYKYIDAIEDPEVNLSEGTVSLLLNSEFASMVERGSAQAPWDLKPQFLRNGKAVKNPTKSGASIYRIIPLNVDREPVPRMGVAWYSNPKFRIVTNMSTGWIWKSSRRPYEIVTAVQEEGVRILTKHIQDAIEDL